MSHRLELFSCPIRRRTDLRPPRTSADNFNAKMINRRYKYPRRFSS
ncbi:hypothetical protein [Candidatus Bathycorpusculum sp.]|nr:hypothetical protein [Candidatus Termitimicrobium sp.]